MMNFHLDRRITVLFKSWTAEDSKDLILYLLLVFAIALLYECLRGFQKYFVFKLLMSGQSPCSQKERDSLLRKRLMKHIFATLIYIAQLTFGYFLMLLVMTYNSLIFVTVIVGIVIGYFLSEPLILRGLDSYYLARLMRRNGEEERVSLNGHRRMLFEAEEPLNEIT